MTHIPEGTKAMQPDHAAVITDVAVIKTDIAYINDAIAVIRKSIEGNGTPGLNQRVGGLELWRAKESGIVSVILTSLPILISCTAAYVSYLSYLNHIK